MTKDDRYASEIKVTIAQAKGKFTGSKKKVLLTNRLRLDIKKKKVKTLVWTVLPYGCAMRMLKKEKIRRD